MSRIDTTLKDIAEDIAGSTDPSWSTIRQDLETLRADLAKLGEKSLAEGQERLSQEVERIKVNVSELASRVGKKSQDGLEVATDYVRQRPLVSVTGAFAIGMLFASLSRRR